MTVGDRSLYEMALTEAGEIRIRWNISRCRPSASATTALIGSAWETTTMVSDGCIETSSLVAATIRSCIWRIDSPPGKQKPLG